MSSCKSGLTVNIVEIQSAYRDRISSSMKRTGPFQIFLPRMQSTGLTKTRVSSLFSLISSFELPLSRVMDEIDFFLFFLRNNVASYLRFSRGTKVFCKIFDSIEDFASSLVRPN